MISWGSQVWSKEARELGFPRQGINLSKGWNMQYFQISIGLGRFRAWIFYGWGMRWNWRRPYAQGD